MDFSEGTRKKYQQEFQKKKKIRLRLLIVTAAVLIGLPLSGEILNIPRIVWVPLLYIIMFSIIISYAFILRCPVCNRLMGDVLMSKFCSRCGFKFVEESDQ